MADTMKIKIAVAVGTDDDGPVWQAYGSSSDKDESWGEVMCNFDCFDDERRYWITAEVPIPDVRVQEIAGEVTEAEPEPVA